MKHDIPPETLNSNIEFCIDEYVRLEKHREMLRDRWFCGLPIEQVAEKYGISVTAAKDVIYGIGDTILLRAAKMETVSHNPVHRMMLFFTKWASKTK